MSLDIHSSRVHALYRRYSEDISRNNGSSSTNSTSNKEKRKGGKKSSSSKINRSYKNSNKSNNSSNSLSEPGSSGNKSDSLLNQNKSIASKLSKCSSDIYQRALYNILQTVNDLEHSLIEDHQQDYKLRMALDSQMESVHDLRISLTNEQERSQRLLNLLENVNSTSSTDDEYYDGCDETFAKNFATISKAFGSVSPLLMQQRYDELSISYKQCRHQLMKKEKALGLCHCEKEIIQAKYEKLMDEFRAAHKRFENLCSRYLRLQKRKNFEIQQLRDALTNASDCVISAQAIIDNCPATATKEFNQNLQLFIRSLQLCQWSQCHCNSIKYGNDSNKLNKK